jgi:quercetin dioxygenase-like cupin family protein
MDLAALQTLHIMSEDVPYVEMEPGLEYRILQARPEDNLTVTQVRAQPGASTGLHQHASPVFGWTVRGAWGHDRDYKYRPGSYIYETPGVPHRFLNGDEVTEAIFVSLGDVEHLDPATEEVVGAASTADILGAYLRACEEAGLPTPEILP